MTLVDQVKGKLTKSHEIFQTIRLRYSKLTSENWASVAQYDRAASPSLRLLGVIVRLSRAAERWVDATAEGTIVALILVGFVVLWMIFWAVTTAPLDVTIDVGEASLWMQHFAFGYKHPPMTGWLFMLWFAVFPREPWSADLLTVTSDAIALAVSWRLLRDHLDKNRALLGLIALILIPLYTVKAEALNANTVMMPFWAATLLFYLRARRSLGIADACLAGAFAGLTMLGKYWAVFLFAGMATAALTGPGVRRFWRSPAPYLMALSALIVIAPHVWWMLSHRESAQFAEGVIHSTPFGEAVWRSTNYILGAIAYAAMPLIFFAALRPSRAAWRDILWPADELRRQAVVLFIVPLLLPAVVNLVIPYRLTPDWTWPNWALLPLVLYGSPALVIDAGVAARGGLIGLALVLAIVVASPAIALVRLTQGSDLQRRHTQQIAETAQKMASGPIKFIWVAGTNGMSNGLPFYLPESQPSATADKSGTLLLVCLREDTACQSQAATLVAEGARTTTVAFTRSFLGMQSPPGVFSITVASPAGHPAE
jgi:4-amino-4-deoxy-L-arabinose transferase-like glycosyltransferase